ncbi:MAG: hypothetical protein FWD28_05725 [Treponema sp.]|nr:hypothetical protein [Treponema sp.]
MKFKYLIIAFSIIILIVILVIALLPLVLSRSADSSEFAVNFQFLSLPLLIFMVLLLVCMSIFFFLNYRLLSLLEREDWPALAYYLEQKVFVKNRYNSRNVRLLASSYLVISDYLSVLKLESKANLKKPSVINKSVLIFGSARILSGNYGEAAAFFKAQLSKCKSKDKEWVRWFHGFSYLLAGAFNAVESEFSSLAGSSKDAFITGLSAYFLYSSILKYSMNPEQCKNTAENGKQRVKKVFSNIEDWTREADRVGTDMHIAIVRKYIDEAGKWIWDLLPPPPPPEPKDRRSSDRRVSDRRKEGRSTSDRRTSDRRARKVIY